MNKHLPTLSTAGKSDRTAARTAASAAVHDLFDFLAIIQASGQPISEGQWLIICDMFKACFQFQQHAGRAGI